MKKIFTILCACLVLAAVSNASAQSLRVLDDDLMQGSRICLLHVYEWNELATSVVVSEQDPFYVGGWNTTVTTDSQTGYLLLENGITGYPGPQPIRVDYTAGKVWLEAGDDVVFTLSGTSTVTTGTMTTTVDSTQYFYLINEDWLVNNGDYADIEGEIMEDGSIHFPGGFAYYIETSKTTTITRNGQVINQFTDQTDAATPLYRDTWLIVPNGKHEYTSQADGTTMSNDVYMRQSGDTVYVTNLWGYGGPECYMVLETGGTMTYPGQPFRDIPADMSTGGTGMWTNASSASALGNTGTATPQAIAWDLTVPVDGTETWQGWTDNSLTWTNGNEFVIPGGQPEFILGDVNRDGSVTISDVTALIDHLLSGDFEDSEDFSSQAADTSQDGNIGISDVTALIDMLLSGN